MNFFPDFKYLLSIDSATFNIASISLTLQGDFDLEMDQTVLLPKFGKFFLQAKGFFFGSLHAPFHITRIHISIQMLEFKHINFGCTLHKYT